MGSRAAELEARILGQVTLVGKHSQEKGCERSREDHRREQSEGMVSAGDQLPSDHVGSSAG